MDLFAFTEWLKKEMDAKGVTQADLSKSSGMSASQLSKIMHMKSEPSKDALTAIARGLHIPPELVFQKANIFSANLPPDARISPEATELATIALALEPDDRRLLLDVARLLYRRVKPH